MNNTLKTVDYTRSLPPTLKQDSDLLAIGKTLSEELQKLAKEYDQLLIYARMDELPEKMIDLLAYDFHVDWYDYRLSLDKKRKMLKDSMMVHRHLGTRYGVEKVLQSVFEKVTILEWFEQTPQGKPFTFKLALDASDSGVSKEIQKELVRQLSTYKNLRSHLEEIGIILFQEGKTFVGAFGTSTQNINIQPRQHPPKQQGNGYVACYPTKKLKIQIAPYRCQ